MEKIKFKGKGFDNDNLNINSENFRESLSIENKYLIQIVKETDDAAMHQIRKYCKEKGIIPYIISAEKIDLIIKLGIERYNEIYKEEKR